jgi:hypothetical protein
MVRKERKSLTAVALEGVDVNNALGSDFAHAQAPLGDHTVFLVDFGHCQSDAPSPACGQESRLRGR